MSAKRLKTRLELQADADLEEQRRELIRQVEELADHFGFSGHRQTPRGGASARESAGPGKEGSAGLSPPPE